ncbi:MAG: ABC transporter ATP-binding protein [Christensenellales bacterium]|jgi:spermidine/putrescine transport system ATP-binding protein
MEERLIDLLDISKEFNGKEALKGINLFIRPKEFVTLLGPSGCGKTTTLRIIGGFEVPNEGRVLFEGKDITNLPPYKRPVNTIFQRYALFPHLDVYNNIAFGPKLKQMSKGEITKRVSWLLDLVNLEGYEKRDVESLSGGEQQRVAIARALINEPKVLLLDEPLAALDLKLRKGMQLELKNIQKRLGITFVFVTHDQEEALTMSDIIVVMRGGRIQQIGTPIDIYNEPKNAFVADFIGESNILPGIMLHDYLVSFAGSTFPCVDAGFPENSLVEVVVRPEDIKVVSSEAGMLRGTVTSVLFMGVHYEIAIQQGERSWLVHSTAKAEPGTVVGLDIYPDDIHIMRKDSME